MERWTAGAALGLGRAGALQNQPGSLEQQLFQVINPSILLRGPAYYHRLLVFTHQLGYRFWVLRAATSHADGHLRWGSGQSVRFPYLPACLPGCLPLSLCLSFHLSSLQLTLDLYVSAGLCISPPCCFFPSPAKHLAVASQDGFSGRHTSKQTVTAAVKVACS